MKVLKVVLALIVAIMLFGCSKRDLTQEYYDSVVKMVSDKGYTVEELTALKPGEEVTKTYDNAILARFGKIQGYLYTITEKMVYVTHSGKYTKPIYKSYEEYDVLPLEEVKAKYADYKDDIGSGSYTVKLSKMIIMDGFYNNDLSLYGCTFPTGEPYTCENYLSEKEILQLKDPNIFKEVTQPYTLEPFQYNDTATVRIDDGSIQLKLPKIKNDKE